MARAALQMSVRDLAEAAKVATGTVVRMEAGEELKERTVEAMQRAFEERGLEFTNGDTPGVRAKAAPQKKTAARRKK
jgi:predicted transcriptional regulator